MQHDDDGRVASVERCRFFLMSIVDTSTVLVAPITSQSRGVHDVLVRRVGQLARAFTLRLDISKKKYRDPSFLFDVRVQLLKLC